MNIYAENNKMQGKYQCIALLRADYLIYWKFQNDVVGNFCILLKVIIGELRILTYWYVVHTILVPCRTG